MYSVLEKSQTVVPALKLSVPGSFSASLAEQPLTTQLTCGVNNQTRKAVQLCPATVHPVEKESGFLVLESEIAEETVEEVALAPVAVVKKESKS